MLSALAGFALGACSPSEDASATRRQRAEPSGQASVVRSQQHHEWSQCAGGTEQLWWMTAMSHVVVRARIVDVIAGNGQVNVRFAPIAEYKGEVAGSSDMAVGDSTCFDEIFAGIGEERLLFLFNEGGRWFAMKRCAGVRPATESVVRETSRLAREQRAFERAEAPSSPVATRLRDLVREAGRTDTLEEHQPPFAELALLAEADPLGFVAAMDADTQFRGLVYIELDNVAVDAFEAKSTSILGSGLQLMDLTLTRVLSTQMCRTSSAGNRIADRNCAQAWRVWASRCVELTRPPT